MTQNSTPLVSVVMAVYNGGEYLRDAIESILAQTLSDFEFIIINDGSIDQTSTIISEYAKKDSRIVSISRENRGLVASLNEGVSLAKSDLIARMDADDISFTNRLELQTIFMNKNPNVVCIGSYYEVIDEDGDSLTVLDAPNGNEDIQAALIKGHTVICHPTAVYRKESFLRVGGYDKNFFLVEDLDLWLKLGEVGKLANIPYVLVKYRTSNSSVSTQSGQLQLKKAGEVVVAASKRRGVVADFQLTEHWRPNSSKESLYLFSLKYGWWAFNSNNKKAAVKYAKRSIKIIPWRLDGWRLYITSMIKLRAN